MLDDKGQTGIEYILMIAVMMTIIISMMSKVRERLIGTKFPCPRDDNSLGCVITRSVSSFGSDPSFRYFRLRK